jgi:hypothetical protein
MGFLLVVLILFLIFLNNEIFNKTPPQTSYRNVEKFSEEAYPIGYGNSFNPNSRSNDYFYDRTGLKGSLFRKMSPIPIYESEKKEPVPIMSQNDIVHKLELYPIQFYEPCKSDFIQSQLLPPVYKKPDYLNDYLNFDQGVLIRQSCGVPKGRCDKI